MFENNAEEAILHFQYPCNSIQEATILYDVLRVDKEPSRNTVRKLIEVKDKTLHITLHTTIAKNLKPSFNSILDYILLSKATIDTFGPPVSDKYDYY